MIQPLKHNNWTRTLLLKPADYPCLCLCFGFSQITLIRPFLLIILHFSQIGFTDDLTFTAIPPFSLPFRYFTPYSKSVRVILYHSDIKKSSLFSIFFHNNTYTSFHFHMGTSRSAQFSFSCPMKRRQQTSDVSPEGCDRD